MATKGRSLPKTSQAAKNRATKLREQAARMEKRANDLKKKEDTKCTTPASTLRKKEQKINRLAKELDKEKSTLSNMKKGCVKRRRKKKSVVAE